MQNDEKYGKEVALFVIFAATSCAFAFQDRSGIGCSYHQNIRNLRRKHYENNETHTIPIDADLHDAVYGI